VFLFESILAFRKIGKNRNQKGQGAEVFRDFKKGLAA
jgi:hypothetical protein